MADTKITALAAITTVDPAADVLPIVDISDTSMAASGTTKKITSNQILGSGGTATLASATITGDLTVATSGLKIDSATGRSAFNASTYASSIGVMQSSASYYAGFTLRNSAGTTGATIGLDASGSGSGSQDFSIAAVGTNLSFVSGNNLQYKIAHPGVFTWYDGAGGTRMTLNSTGLGVGASPATKLDVNGGTGGIGGQNHATFSGTAGRGLVISTRSDNVSADRSGVFNAPFTGGTIVIQTQGTDRLLVDSSGNVGVGVTPSASWTGGANLQVGGYAAFYSNGSLGAVDLSSNSIRTASDSYQYISTNNATRLQQRDGSFRFFIAPSGTAGNAITFTQAMTLDASGNLLVGTTSVLNSARVSFKTASVSSVLSLSGVAGDTLQESFVINKFDSNSTTSQVFARFTNGNGANGSGQINGNGANACAFGSFSDARLKENIVSLPSQLANILSLRPVEFDYKDGSGHQIGFVAQEMQEVYSDAVAEQNGFLTVTGWSKTEARLVSAIKELAAKVQALEAKLA